jgi:hypothetical protein
MSIHYNVCAGIALLDVVLLYCVGFKVASVSISADRALALEPLRSFATSLATSDSSTSSGNSFSNTNSNINNNSNSNSSNSTSSATKRRNSINAQSAGAAITDCSHNRDGYEHMSNNSSSNSSNYNSNSNDVNYDTIDLESPATWRRTAVV